MIKSTIQAVPEEPKSKHTLSVIQLANYVRPEIKEVASKQYVLNGDKNSFYKDIINAYNGSPTNRTVINSYSKFIYGKGLKSNQQASKAVQFANIVRMLSKKDLRAICKDYEMFGEASAECIYKKGEIVQVKHVAKQRVVPSKMDSNGDITSYWFSYDFSNPTKYPPVEIPAFTHKDKATGSCIYIFTDYQAGKTYFADPDYLPGIPYATLEEEIANYCVSHIQNGLSFGHTWNMNNGEPESKQVKEAIEAKIKGGGTGSSNAGKVFVNWNENKDTAITVTALEVSDAHEQYQFLSGEATQKILIAHAVTSPILFGIKDNTGLGNNANEQETAFNELMINVIQPKQEVILDGLMEIFNDAGYTIDLDFIPLRIPTEGATQLSLSEDKEEPEADDFIATELLKLGEEIDPNEWELIDEQKQEGEPSINEFSLNLALAYVPSNFPERDSEQDTELFKVRYEYKGSLTPQRSFCVKMMSADLVYRKEDIDAAGRKAVNAGFGPNGTDKYSIWLYKGGANCHHYWQRKIYLKANNDVITASKFREILNGLDTEERRKNDLEVNDPLVAKRPEFMPNNGYLKPRK